MNLIRLKCARTTQREQPRLLPRTHFTLSLGVYTYEFSIFSFSSFRSVVRSVCRHCRLGTYTHRVCPILHWVCITKLSKANDKKKATNELQHSFTPSFSLCMMLQYAVINAAYLTALLIPFCC